MTRILIGLLALSAIAQVTGTRQAASAGGGSSVHIAVQTPKSGAQVGQDLLVEGTVELAAGQHVWLVNRREDFSPLFWPQREAIVDPHTNAWKAMSVFGGPQDVSWTFDVQAVVVDAAGHAALHAYWLKAMQTGDWRPIVIPKPVSVSSVIKVKKVRH